MTKIEMLRSLYSDKVIDRKNRLVGEMYILVDETTKRYYVSTYGFNRWRRARSTNSLPAAALLYLRDSGKNINDPSHSVILSVKLTDAELAGIFPGYRTFKTATSLLKLKTRQSGELNSDLWEATHKTTGVRVFSSLIAVDSAHSKVDNSRVSNLAVQILRARVKNLPLREMDLFKEAVKSGSVTEWNIRHVRVMSSADTRITVRLLNESAMAENIAVLSGLVQSVAQV